ncbi:MAG: cell envelope integrity protein TolA [Desulfamplus sp.]|nr:cell envelope integrity protein TolA [Desulfamplus sp.]
MSSLDFLQSISSGSRRDKRVEPIPSLTMMYGLSIALHALLVLVVIFTQNLNPVPVVPFAVQVDLVSFSPGPPESSSSASGADINESAQPSAIKKSADGDTKSIIKQPKNGSKVKSVVEPHNQNKSDVPIKSLKKKSLKPDNEVKTEAPEETAKVEQQPEPKPKPEEPKVKTKPEPEVKPEPKIETKVKPEPKTEAKPEPEVVEKAEIQEPVIAKKKESLKKKTYDSEKVEKSEKEAVASKQETSKDKTVAEKTTESSQPNTGKTNTAKNKKQEQETSDKDEGAEDGGGAVEKEKQSGGSNSGKKTKSSTDSSGSDGDEQGKSDLASALSRMKSKVATQSSKRGSGAGTGSGVGSGIGSIASSGGQGAGTTSEAIGLYNLELMYKIRQNWSFNEKLAGAENKIEVRILIKILQNGEIRDIWFETRSGNAHLDDSALKAVKRSNPLPPLPSGYTSYDIGLIFTPSGLK